MLAVAYDAGATIPRATHHKGLTSPNLLTAKNTAAESTRGNPAKAALSGPKSCQSGPKKVLSTAIPWLQLLPSARNSTATQHVSPIKPRNRLVTQQAVESTCQDSSIPQNPSRTENCKPQSWDVTCHACVNECVSRNPKDPQTLSLEFPNLKPLNPKTVSPLFLEAKPKPKP